MVRYADDAVIGFQHENNANACLEGLKRRLSQFGLSVHPNKTKLIHFGRFAFEDFKRGKVQRPGTFDFLGFTHYCDLTKSRKAIMIKRKTIKKRLISKIKWVRQELKKRLHLPPWKVGKWLN
nr:hypothetical protein OAM_17250 [Vibrio cyclitrophicus ZF14]